MLTVASWYRNRVKLRRFGPVALVCLALPVASKSLECILLEKAYLRDLYIMHALGSTPTLIFVLSFTLPRSVDHQLVASVNYGLSFQL